MGKALLTILALVAVGSLLRMADALKKHREARGLLKRRAP